MTVFPAHAMKPCEVEERLPTPLRYDFPESKSLREHHVRLRELDDLLQSCHSNILKVTSLNALDQDIEDMTNNAFMAFQHYRERECGRAMRVYEGGSLGHFYMLGCKIRLTTDHLRYLNDYQ